MPNSHLRTPDGDAIPSELFDQQLGTLLRFESRATNFFESLSVNLGIAPMGISCLLVDEQPSGGYFACAVHRSASENYRVVIPVTFLGVLYWHGRSLNSIPFLEAWSEYNDASPILESRLVDRVLSEPMPGTERLGILAGLNCELPFYEDREPFSRGFVSAITKFIAGHEFAHIYQRHLHLRDKLEDGGYCAMSETDWLHGAEFTADSFGFDNLARPMGRSVAVNEVGGLLWSLGSLFAGMHVREKRFGNGGYPTAVNRFALLCETLRETDKSLVDGVLHHLVKDYARLSKSYQSDALSQYSSFADEISKISHSEIMLSRRISNTIRDASLKLYEDHPTQIVPTNIVRINMS